MWSETVVPARKILAGTARAAAPGTRGYAGTAGALEWPGSTGLSHVFLGEEPDPEALAKLVRRLTETDLVYWSFTLAQTHCPKCGRTLTGLYTACPECGHEGVEVWSRIVGYYRPLRNWNPARRREFWTRRHYTL